ncbi:MAG: universal stress protein [Thermoplasmatales archaeon]|jgi:nucleotide-binding universal stress UspA family protein|nr:universal stress protein [Candidatus Thermoplasmatota archaeon]MCL6002381.1 universal stress protein [Candidatus Thermoplasmatota archaeon]MDA8056320.1 universal stress protein [Thermoplasmatales archaeon]
MDQKKREVLPLSKILVAIDGTKPSMRALDMGISLAKVEKNLQMDIIMVVPYPVQYVTGENPTGDLTIVERLATLKERGETILNHAKDYSISNGVMNLKTYLKQGDPAREILDLANSIGPDLIVIGNRKRGFLRGVFLGSVSQRVAANSTCAVLVVK